MKVGLHVYSAGERNAYGAYTPLWTPALDEPGAEVEVICWAPHTSTELGGVEPDRLVETDVDLFVGPDFSIAPEDVVDLTDGQYQVQGEALDYGTGPFGYRPGKVVRLKRV